MYRTILNKTKKTIKSKFEIKRDLEIDIGYLFGLAIAIDPNTWKSDGGKKTTKRIEYIIVILCFVIRYTKRKTKNY